MAQKTKVKELVGRGLNSYHTKALQQIHRIEKKNKEQNHKISILSNELDNDYLTKTEEGSVISLEHSKEGMVYLDELQGNTLVNYCTDGSKEMTLNGDIDVEGTFVTTTEGVDNGLVDVACEGNTLVNLFSGKITDLYGGNYRQEEDGYITLVQKPYGDCIHLKTDMYKPNTTYTLIVDVKENTLPVTCALQVDKRTYMKSSSGVVPAMTKGLYKMVFTTIDDFSTTIENKRWGFYFQFSQANQETKGDITLRFILLEGDWTNKEIPSYFTEMKSVGQDDENGHKIEILSRNKNHVLSKPKTVVQDIVSHDIYLEPNKEYSISSNVPYNSGLCMISKNHSNTNPIFTFQNWGETVNKFTTPNNLEKGIYSLVFWKSQLSADDNSWTQVELGKTITNYIPYNSNKKEILINEPLRAVDNVKDKFVKIGNKYFIERNCAEVCLDGSKIPHMNDEWLTENQCVFHVSNIIHGREPHTVISNSFKAGSVINTNQNIECIQIGGSGVPYTNVYVKINKSRLTTVNSEGVKTYLQANPIRLVYILATPTYEPVQIEPVLNTYNDITHISNNSIIPCNMKIKNTGYNAIIKPSTLYTVALDTNKSGTIGMNLGGIKVTTTNNVATITTPATLADDSLRLYGKGIKGSKVRLLEGDKTNWIPSYFEGMKSSFEDKVQEDGTYKMEILSNNENLLILEKEPYFWRNSNKSIATRRDDKIIINGLVNQGWDAINLGYSSLLKSDTKYTITCKINQNMNVTHGVVLRYKHNGIIVSTSNYLWGGGDVNISKYTFTTPRISFDTIEVGYMVTWDGDKLTQTYTNLEFSEIGINEVYNPNKSNKIQFLSIEPLRGLPNGVKDRFLFKDNKLMIERNTKKIFLNNQTISSMTIYDIAHNGTMLPFSFKLKNSDCKKGAYIEVPCNKFATSSNSYRGFPTTCIQQYIDPSACFVGSIHITNLKSKSGSAILEYFNDNNIEVTYQLAEPTYEEIPFELQKIILEGYENGTLFFDTNIPPTSTITYAGETPIVKSVKLNKTEVLNNTEDINDNIIPYLMDMDYRVVMLQLATEELEGGVSMARLFGGTYEMIKRDILSKRLTREEYGYRLADYYNVGKLTEEQVRELEELR